MFRVDEPSTDIGATEVEIFHVSEMDIRGVPSGQTVETIARKIFQKKTFSRYKTPGLVASRVNDKFWARPLSTAHASFCTGCDRLLLENFVCPLPSNNDPLPLPSPRCII